MKRRNSHEAKKRRLFGESSFNFLSLSLFKASESSNETADRDDLDRYIFSSKGGSCNYIPLSTFFPRIAFLSYLDSLEGIYSRNDLASGLLDLTRQASCVLRRYILNYS